MAEQFPVGTASDAAIAAETGTAAPVQVEEGDTSVAPLTTADMPKAAKKAAKKKGK